MSHIDLRDRLAAVESHGDLKRIEGANWDLEMSAIVTCMYREGKTPKPALMFDEVSSYPKGFR
jgi:3-polyprenyl-4-hydroxybenzoate decarboxylase